MKGKLMFILLVVIFIILFFPLNAYSEDERGCEWFVDMGEKGVNVVIEEIDSVDIIINKKDSLKLEYLKDNIQEINGEVLELILNISHKFFLAYNLCIENESEIYISNNSKSLSKDANLLANDLKSEVINNRCYYMFEKSLKYFQRITFKKDLNTLAWENNLANVAYKLFQIFDLCIIQSYNDDQLFPKWIKLIKTSNIF